MKGALGRFDAARVGDRGVVASLADLIALRGPALSFSHYRAARTGAGGRGAVRRGMGMEFAEARPYQPGDDARHVDWRQTARHGRLYTKLFQEEVERPVQLVVDLGSSMRFGTRHVFKSVQAAYAAAWLAWAAIASGERVGGAIWDGRQLHYCRPRGRVAGALAFLGGLVDASAKVVSEERMDLGASLHYLGPLPRAGSVVIVISDFAQVDDETEHRITMLAKRTDLILVMVHDPFEIAPPPGCYRLSDGRDTMTLDLRTDVARESYGAAFHARRARLERLSGRLALPFVSLSTEDEPGPLLLRAFTNDR